MGSEKINEQVQLRITNQLYQHASPAIIAAIINAIILTIVFRNVMPPSINYGWVALSITYLTWRLYFTSSVLRKEINAKNYLTRLRQFTISVFISGSIFGSVGILFLSPEHAAFNAFIFFLIGGMSAGSLGAFAIHKPTFFAFFVPVMLPVVIYGFIIGGEINIAMALISIIFILVMSSLLFRMNITITDAIRLSIENKLLAERTKSLNDKLQLSNQKFQQLSYNDALTNIKNRRFVMEVLNNEINRFSFSLIKSPLRRRITPNNDNNVYGIYMIDIDHFKEVNDTWGHKCGDEILIQFVGLLNSLIRKDDVLSRWGGEEFVIVLKRTTPEYLQQFAEKVIKTIYSASFHLEENKTISKTCSVGYAAYPFFNNHPQLLSLEQTIEIADQALYFAKEHGRNMAVRAAHIVNHEAPISSEEAKLIIKDIPKSIEQGKISLMRSP